MRLTTRLIPFRLCTIVLVCLAGVPHSSLFAVSPLTLTGALGGTVRDVVGQPQMGAVVLLYDHRDKICERFLTGPEGKFAFGGLAPDLYTVRVVLASFLPALRDHIQIQAGTSRFLEVNLSTLFSSIQVVAPEPGKASLMSDDWKWVLRTATSSRPVMRLLPDPSTGTLRGSIFSDTHGVVQVSGGDASSGGQADLGTAFGVSTSFYGANRIEFVGNVGYVSSTGLPTAGFRTKLSRQMGDSTPSVAITMRQMSVPGRVNVALTGVPGLDGGVPFLRTTSLAFANQTSLSDSLDLEYGLEMDSILYRQRTSYNSRYVKLTYRLPLATLDFIYTSGNARPGLAGEHAVGETADLERGLAALADVPRMSLLNRQVKVQQGENFELGISKEIGSREYRVTVYRESVKDAALTVALPSEATGDPFAGQILPDLFSNTSVYDAGDFHSFGYTASVTQNLTENYRVTLSYGMAGVLAPDALGQATELTDGESLRQSLKPTHRGAVTAQVSGTVARTGTRFSGSYQFTDYQSATSGRIYGTDSCHPDSGLNLYLRQPLPAAIGMGGRMEATVDLRNMLAQGYLPYSLTDGRKLLLMRTPRTLRGGLSFTF